MILVVGLGNPGPRYVQTRHNFGFLAIDAFASARGGGRVAPFRSRFQGLYSECEVAGRQVGLLKPETFMNLSGQSVRAAVSFFDVHLAELLVVHDELDLPFAELRLKAGGGDGGHRGLRSINAELQSPGYGRLRLGIGRPALDFQGDIADFVLQAVAPELRIELARVLARASEVVESVVRDGLAQAMNRTNQRMLR